MDVDWSTRVALPRRPSVIPTRIAVDMICRVEAIGPLPSFHILCRPFD